MRQLLQPKRANEHQLYARLRDWTDSHSEERRGFFNSLWAEYESFAPRGFEKKLQIEFHQRWWEMYLVVALLHLGFIPNKNPADVGPDATFDVGGKLVVIEATAPSVGRSSDRVPDPVHNGVADFPERECLLRLTQALTYKNECFHKYIDSAIVSHDASRIIALSASDLNQFGTLLDSIRPAPLSVLAGVGPTVINIGGEKPPPYSSCRNTLTRDSGSPVDASLFDKDNFSIISGVLYSSVSLWSASLNHENTLALFLNPNAKNPVPSEFHNQFVTWTREILEGNEIVWKMTQPSP